MIKSYVKKCIGQRNVDRMKMMARSIEFSLRKEIKKPDLPAIGSYFKTDKVDIHHTFRGLSYLDIYERYFSNQRERPINILEIGVKDASSLKTWKAYFSTGTVFGIDIDPRCKELEEDRIHIEIGSQDDRSFLGSAFPENRMFDIIIDDGSHINRHILASFEYLFYNRLMSGGIYIIEDLACSYDKLQTNHDVLENWPGMSYNDPNQNYDNDRNEIDEFIRLKLYDLDHMKGDILSIQFWPMICVLSKV